MMSQKKIMLIKRSSFIVSKMDSLGALPKSVAKVLRALGCQHDPGQTTQDRA